jgi:hypothetical protein
VFLSDAASYEGGELVLHLGDRALSIKAEAGDAIVYPSTTLHEVTPVRNGVRLVSITFIESHIVGEQERHLLFELGDVSSLEGDHMNVANRMRLEAVPGAGLQTDSSAISADRFAIASNHIWPLWISLAMAVRAAARICTRSCGE